jgi:4-oxalocrotonate tautomerase
MPLVQVTMMEGRTPEQKGALHREVAAAVHRSVGAPLDAIRVVIHEVPPAHWSVGGVPKTGPSGPPRDEGLDERAEKGSS